MARREEKVPQAHVIERAKSGRAKCQTCGELMEEDELRLSEAYVSDEGRWARAHKNARTPKHREFSDNIGERAHYAQNPDVWARFHHLECAAKSQPYKLRSALNSATIEIPGREHLERAIERALSSVDAAEENAGTRDEYLGFVEKLREAPDDDLMLVFGDWLHSVEDPRGALVAVQHGLETATGDDRVKLHDEERKLIAEHRKQLVPERADQFIWHRGFVHRMVATTVESTSLARSFAHPSLRLLREFAVEADNWTIVAPNLPPLPATLRALELANRNAGLGEIAPLLAKTLPQLETLRLSGTADLAGLKHANLSTLELACVDAASAQVATARGEALAQTDRVPMLRKKDLPKLTTIVLRSTRNLDALVAAFARTDLVKQVKHVVLHGDLTLAGMKPLLGKKLDLDVLDVKGTPLTPLERGKLEAIAASVLVDEPVATQPPPPPSKPREWLVRHTRRPEWGIGKVIEETEDGMQVEFETGGAKLVRNVELLEEVEPTD